MWNSITKIGQHKNNAVRLVKYMRTIPETPPAPIVTLKERLEKLKYKDPDLYFRVDIGFPSPVTKSEMKKRIKYLSSLKNNKELERASRTLTLEVDYDEITKDWLKTVGPEHIFTIADHYGIYNDLFKEGYFIPYQNIEIGFPQPNELEAPVYRGNIVKPAEACSQPNVRFTADPDTYWTLVLTSPDGHLTEENMEYVHWFIGNIPGNNVSEGEIIWDYLPPFPPRGVGFQRFVFVLYKQDKKIDYSPIKGELPRLELKDRTFNTFDFYKERQDYITPAGLAFFQSDWDVSVIKTFHEILNMEEPIFEYDFDVPYRKEQEWFPKKKPFNLYLDQFRDPRDIAKEYLLKKVENLNPFEVPKKPFIYPNIHPISRSLPSWLAVKIERDRTGRGRIADQKEDEYE